MIEEMLDEGLTPAQIQQELVDGFGMTPGDAGLLLQTAMGGPGDDLDATDELELEAFQDDDDDGLTVPA